jgi:hypothetical protein
MPHAKSSFKFGLCQHHHHDGFVFGIELLTSAGGEHDNDTLTRDPGGVIVEVHRRRHHSVGVTCGAAGDPLFVGDTALLEQYFAFEPGLDVCFVRVNGMAQNAFDKTTRGRMG